MDRLGSLATRLRTALFRLRTLGRRDAMQRDLAEEMRMHQEYLARDLAHGGLPATDAAGEARRRFGNSLALRERSAEQWGAPALAGVWQDLRYGARALVKSPGFAAVAIGAIAIAIGVNAGFFTLVDFFLWRPLPVTDPARLVRPLTVDARGWESIRFSYPDLQTIAGHATTLSDVVGFDAEPIALRWTAPGALAYAGAAALVTANYFTALGGAAAVGRTLQPADDLPGAAPVVILSDAFWNQAFQRAPDVLQRDLVINGVHVAIVGVARSDFVGANPLVPHVWMTYQAGAAVGAVPGSLTKSTNRFIVLHAHVRPGVTRPQVAAELSGLLKEPPAAPGTQAALTRIVGVHVQPSESLAPPSQQTYMVALPGMVVVGLVLAIACANLATLLVARALVRQREIAIRLSVGASRWRIVRQLLTESLLIAFLGAAAGFLLSKWTVMATSRSFFSIVPVGLGQVMLDMSPSWRVVVYTAGLAVVSVMFFGLTPALQATTPNLTAALKGEDAALGLRFRRSRFRDALVALQVAASVVLLVVAGTLIGTLRGAARRDIGLDPRGLTAASLGQICYAADDGSLCSSASRPSLPDERARFAARAAAMPGVASTARVAYAPWTGSWPLLHFADADAPRTQQLAGLPHNVVTPGYFALMHQRLLSGRDFTAEDSANDAPVAIVTASAARALWPRRPAVGHAIRVAISDTAERIYRVVGVVADARSAMVWDWDGDGYIYLPASPAIFRRSPMPLLVRSDGRTDVTRGLQEIAREIDPDQPLSIQPLVKSLDLQFVPFRYAATIATAVGLLGLGLAVIGLYGIVAFAVRQRRRDVALHVALGATGRDVMRLVLRRDIRLVLFGLGAGLLASVGMAKLLASALIVLAPMSLGGWVLIAGLLLLVAVVAMVVPGMAALRVAPMEALRQE